MTSLKSLKHHEGLLMIDNRVSEGVPEDVVRASGLPVGAGQGLFEAATYTCSHCQFVVVLEPKRTRPRAFCTGCGQRICDPCDAVRHQTLTCRPMEQIFDEVLESAIKQAETAPPLPLLDSMKRT